MDNIRGFGTTLSENEGPLRTPKRTLLAVDYPSSTRAGAAWRASCLSPFKHVTARRVPEREIRGATHSRGRAQSAGPLRKPGGPVHPPASIVLGCILPPGFGRFEAYGRLNRPICALSAGRIDDPGDVAAGGKHEAHVAATSCVTRQAACQGTMWSFSA